MAMYEIEGFCPSNSFFHYGIKLVGEKATKARDIMNVLGDRTGYMVYDGDNVTYGTNNPTIVELLLEDEIGIDVAKMLAQLIPECQYAKVGKKILIKDVINPRQIPGIYNVTEKMWSFINHEGTLNINCPVFHEENRHMFTSDNFVSVVENQDAQVVIWIFKYPTNN